MERWKEDSVQLRSSKEVERHRVTQTSPIHATLIPKFRLPPKSPLSGSVHSWILAAPVKNRATWEYKSGNADWIGGQGAAKNPGQMYYYYWASRDESEGYRTTLGAKELSQNTLCLPSPPAHPNQDILCKIWAWVWYLTLQPYTIFSNKKDPRLTMPRVPVHVYIDRIVLGI